MKIDFRSELNDEQYAAVTASPGPALVLAGAGSGKTRTLTYRVAYLLLERRVHPDNILLLTFTNKAAREMLERVGDLCGDMPKPRWGGTFHSVGGRILRRHAECVGLKANFTILDQDDAEHTLQAVIKHLDKDFLKSKQNPKLGRIAGLISMARNTGQSVASLCKVQFPYEDRLADAIPRFAAAYQERKLEQNVADYDDLLVYWLRLMEDYPELREAYNLQFPFILVDEYQDTNFIQSKIIDCIGGHHNIMAVGDDAQCIYTWRGANFENIRDFPQRHPGTTLYKIETNYRSTPQILDFANAVLAAQPEGHGYAKELRPVRKDSMVPYFVPVLDGRQQAQFLVSRIEYLYEQGVGLRDIAVLYRAHYQALDAQLEFSRRGIPFIITSGVRFFEQAHVRDFVAQLRAISNPEDYPAFERFMGLLPKVGPATVGKLLKAARQLAAKRAQQWEAARDDLFEPSGQLESPSVFAALLDPAILDKVPQDARDEYSGMCLSLREMDVMLNGPAPRVQHTPARPVDVVRCGVEGWYGDYLKHVYSNWESRRDDLDGLIEFAARYDTMHELLAQLVLLNAETTDRSIQDNDNTVRMTTIHQAKGLEYPVVFVLGCADELFPLKRALEDGNLDEERRLFYVAVTRAKDELYLCYPRMTSGRGNGPMLMRQSRFISEVPPHLYEKVHVPNYSW